jgi:hypothetical protein
MECTIDHIDGMSFFGSLGFWLGWSWIGFFYRQSLTSVVTIEWRCIHSILWSHDAQIMLPSFCKNLSQQLQSDEYLTLMYAKLCWKFAFHTVSNRGLYFNFLWLIANDPLSHGSWLSKANII